MPQDVPFDARSASQQGLTVHEPDEPATIDPHLVLIRSVMSDAPQRDRTSRAVEAQIDKREKESRQGARRMALLSRLWGRVLDGLKRPDLPRLLAFMLLIYLSVANTGLVLFFLFICIVSALVIYLSVGPERVKSWALYRYEKLRLRDPKAAERLRRRAAMCSSALGWVISRLPESWTRGLYLPDFDEPDEQDAHWATDPFERLARKSSR